MILGGVLFGIGVALLCETYRADAQPTGPGLAGLYKIDFSGDESGGTLLCFATTAKAESSCPVIGSRE